MGISIINLPKEVHIEERARDKTEAQVQEGCNKDTWESWTLYPEEMVPEFGRVTSRGRTVILESLEYNREFDIRPVTSVKYNRLALDSL